MESRSTLAAAFGLAAVLSASWARGDEGDVAPPPPVPASQMPGPARTAPDPPQGWTPNGPQGAGVIPSASPQAVTVPVAATSAPQTVMLQIQLVPSPAPALTTAAAPPSTLPVVHTRPPGPLGRMVGKVGQTLTRAGMTRLYVPTQEVQQVVYTPSQSVQLSAPPVAAAPVQASSQAGTPALTRKWWLQH